MPSLISFSAEIVSISFGSFVASSLKVPALLVASFASPGKRKVSPLMTIVVCFTSSPGNAFPSCIAETRFQLPCSPSKSFLDAGSSTLSAANDRLTAAIISNCAFMVIFKAEELITALPPCDPCLSWHTACQAAKQQQREAHGPGEGGIHRPVAPQPTIIEHQTHAP